jgi:hypothetical protein
VAAIPERYLDKLRAAGLLISKLFVPNHRWFPGGVIVSKPTSVAGHSLPGYEARWGITEITLNAPSLWFHCDGDKWFVTSHDYIPGPGLGDFVNEWSSPEEAVADILDFFFGNPARMDIKREAREATKIRD